MSVVITMEDVRMRVETPMVALFARVTRDINWPLTTKTVSVRVTH